MSPLNKKLGRDLWRMKGQALAIAVVIALGVLMLVMMDGLVNSLDETRAAYYDRYRLADVFAPVKRAPDHVLKSLERIKGVDIVEGRIIGGALLNLDDEAVPIRAHAVALPDFTNPRLNDIYLVEGRRINTSRKDEILLLEGFAKARGLSLGDKITATMNGARRQLEIIGFVQSPEFLYAVAPGEIAPNDANFAVFWMSHEALAAAYDLDGAFNEALIELAPDADLKAVIQEIDRLMAKYGGAGAYGLEDQLSNRFVSEEISSLRTSARTVPPVFLGVAAFLLYIVISRIVQSEREQIGLLKAFGYTSREISFHYFKFIIAVALGGAVLGCLFGILSGRGMVELYLHYFKFPFLVFSVDPASFIIGITVSVLAASAGGVMVLRRIFALNPAVAMSPPAPADFSKSLRFSERMKKILDQPSRIVIRRFFRHPWRAAASVIGIGVGMALSVAMLSVMESFDEMMDLNFTVIDRSDLSVTFIEPLSIKAFYELEQLPGVIEAEPFRGVPVILRHDRRTHRGALSGFVKNARLNRAIDADNAQIAMREDGLVLSQALAAKLDIKPGDTVTVEVREGRRPILELPVASIAQVMTGAPAYFELDALNRALKEQNRISGAFLRIDQARGDEVYQALKNMPAVAGVSRKAESRDTLQQMIDQGAGGVRYVMAAIAGIITFGIIFNSARIAFAERERDLASLRVNGFTRMETAFVLLGEMGIITLFALPLGILLGRYLSLAVSAGFSTELYQVPVYFSPQSYGIAAAAVLVASLFSGWIVNRDIGKLDLVRSLKTRE